MLRVLSAGLPTIVVFVLTITLWVYLPRVPMEKRSEYCVWLGIASVATVVAILLWIQTLR